MCMTAWPQNTIQKPSDLLTLPNSSASGPSPAASPGRTGVEALKGMVLPSDMACVHAQWCQARHRQTQLWGQLRQALPIAAQI